MPKKIDVSSVMPRIGTSYPAPYDQPSLRRERRALGDAAGLTQFGVNLLRLPAGERSSQRHWHTHEDEYVYVIQGEVTLVTDEGCGSSPRWRLRRLQGERAERVSFAEPF